MFGNQTDTLFVSHPAFQHLGTLNGYQSVLRKFGQIIFGTETDFETAELNEVVKVCKNQQHFLNSYLQSKQSGGLRQGGHPSMEVAFGIQRIAIAFMTGIMFSAFGDSIVSLDKFQVIDRKSVV